MRNPFKKETKAERCTCYTTREPKTSKDGLRVELLSGEVVSMSSLPYMASERFRCQHDITKGVY